MAMKAKVAAGLLPTLLSGLGTYELLRNREGYSLTNTDKDDSKKDQEEKNGKELNEGASTDPKIDTPVLDKDNKVYKQILLSSSPSLKIIDDSTFSETIKNIILHRMFPHFRKEFTFEPNQMFEGSPKITLKGEERTYNNKKLYILGKNSEDDVNSLRAACKSALEKTQTYVKKGDEADPQIYRLKAGCTVPTIRDVLQRHKFKIPTQNDEGKEILNSEWITTDTYQKKQSLLTQEDLTKIKGATEDQAKIKTLKERCNSILNKDFTRTNFPATKELLGDTNADEFQEAALLCTIPTTAENYVKNAMKGVINTSISQEYKGDYCYEEGKSVDDYGKTKTTDPLGGKSFGCAVRMIYHKQEISPSPQVQK